MERNEAKHLSSSSKEIPVRQDANERFLGTSENQKSESSLIQARNAICGEIVTIEAPGVLICGQVGGSSLVEKVMDSDPQHMGHLEPPIAIG